MHFKSVDFVIPDDRLDVGIKVLGRFQYLTPCPDQEVCPSSRQEQYIPPPAFLLHVKSSELTVTLYPQSQTLWFLPPFDTSLSSVNGLKLSPYFVSASDQTVLPPWRPGRGSGFFKLDGDPVIVPKSHVLLESISPIVRTRFR